MSGCDVGHYPEWRQFKCVLFQVAVASATNHKGVSKEKIQPGLELMHREACLAQPPGMVKSFC